jgi:hypothetical protein
MIVQQQHNMLSVTIRVIIPYMVSTFLIGAPGRNVLYRGERISVVREAPQ